MLEEEEGGGGRPQNEPCKRVTLSIAPCEPRGLQTPVILMARSLFHGCGNKSQGGRGGSGGPGGVAERSITFYIVLIMSDVCVGGRGPCAHSSLARRYTGREPDRVSSRETDASIELSVIPPQTQTETARIYISSVRRGIQCVCWAALNSTKFEPRKHSSRHMLLFLPSGRLMGLIHNFNHSEMSL